MPPLVPVLPCKPVTPVCSGRSLDSYVPLNSIASCCSGRSCCPVLQSDQLDPLADPLDRGPVGPPVDQLDRLLQSGQLAETFDQLSQWLLLGRWTWITLRKPVGPVGPIHLALLVFLVFLLRTLPAPSLPGDLVNLNTSFPLWTHYVLAPLAIPENQLALLDQSRPFISLYSVTPCKPLPP